MFRQHLLKQASPLWHLKEKTSPSLRIPAGMLSILSTSIYFIMKLFVLFLHFLHGKILVGMEKSVAECIPASANHYAVDSPIEHLSYF
jgi:hypothetical protein